MKKSILFSLTLSIISFMVFSCASMKNKPQSMQVIRDCTGTYLRFHEKDYHVCNLDALKGFADNQVVQASFSKTAECKDPSQPEMTCMMFHENEGWIQVNSIQ
jgi:hypothetical protein